MLTAYIERNVPGLKMPRTEGERDDAGIRFKGEIGSGRTSTRDAFIMEGKAPVPIGVPSAGIFAATCLRTLFFASTAGWMNRSHRRIGGGPLGRPAGAETPHFGRSRAR
jgi:hypothetical protein